MDPSNDLLARQREDRIRHRRTISYDQLEPPASMRRRAAERLRRLATAIDPSGV